MQNLHSQQYVTFTLHQDLYGLNVTQTREILDQVSVTKVPQSSADLLGVINLRGQVVPVIDMTLKLGLPRKEENRQDSCIIVTEVDIDSELNIVGIQVDEVREVLELANDMIEPAPRLGTYINTRFIKGMGKLDDRFIILLDINRLFDDAELAEFQAVSSPDEGIIDELLEV